MLQTIVILSLTAGIGMAQQNDANKKTPGSNSPNQTQQKQPFLGVMLEPISPALASHMAGVVPQGEGVVITSVAKDSPAAKAGLKSHDILLSFGGQKIHSPEELVGLVRKQKSGDQVEVGYVHSGKVETAKVTIGERPMQQIPENPNVFRFRPDDRFREMFEESEMKDDGKGWESFDAIKLTRIDSKRWKAEIEYRTKDQKKEQKSFEGTLSEIRKDIQAEKDLPPNERTQLIRALNPHEPVFEFHFPPFDRNGSSPQERP
jgi:membrane-associated protease RseP (regulator of RpoE activity)